MYSKGKDDPNWKKWFQEGCKMSEQGKPLEAIKCYNEALKIDPQSWVCWNNKGSAYGKLGMIEEEKQCMQMSNILHVAGLARIKEK